MEEKATLGARLLKYGRTVEDLQHSIAALSKEIRIQKKQNIAALQQRIQEECAGGDGEARCIKVGERQYYAIMPTTRYAAITESTVSDACSAVREASKNGQLKKSLRDSLLDAIRVRIRRPGTQLKKRVRPVKGWSPKEPAPELTAVAEALDACKREAGKLSQKRRDAQQKLSATQAEGLASLASELERPQITVEDTRDSSRYSFKLQTRKKAAPRVPLKSIVSWWPSGHANENDMGYLDVVLSNFKATMNQNSTMLLLRVARGE